MEACSALAPNTRERERYRLRLLALAADTASEESIDLSPCYKGMGDSVFIEDFLPLLLSTKGRSVQREFLHLQENALGDASMQALGTVLKHGKFRFLKVLCLRRNPRVSEQGLLALLETLPQTCPYLEQLDLRGIIVGDRGVALVSGLIERIKTLSMVALSAEEMTEEGCTVLSETIGNCPWLHYLLVKELENSRTMTMQGVCCLVRGMRRSRLKNFNIARSSDVIALEIQNTRGFVRREFPCMVAMCSVTAVKRIGKESPLRVLPVDVYRKLAAMLYQLMPLPF